MTPYRLFFIGYDKRIARVEILNCPTDKDAIAVASNACGDHVAVEVWDRARFVETVDDAAHCGAALP